MAAVRLRPGRSFDGDKLYAFTRDALPGYAAPRFVRVQDALEVTGTFKQCKGNLVREGFDPAAVGEPLFFRDDARRAYVALEPRVYADIRDGRLSL
ncbi:S27A5 synthetase, partial [Alectura lathami]|nr:S27A5 synthetase [Alectura lathami]